MNKGQKRSKASFDVLARIREEQIKRSWSDYELAEKSGITQSTISTWYKRGIEPGIASVEKICDGLGISLAQFFQIDEKMLSKEQKELFEVWSQLSDNQKKKVLAMLKSFTRE